MIWSTHHIKLGQCSLQPADQLWKLPPRRPRRLQRLRLPCLLIPKRHSSSSEGEKEEREEGLRPLATGGGAARLEVKDELIL